MKNEVPAAEEKKETAGELRAETERETRTIAQNGDKDDLQPGGEGMFAISYVDAVNGGAAQETPEFVPTRHELIQLARYWHRRCLDNKWSFIAGPSASAEIRVGPYAERRIARIKELVGKEEVDDAIEECSPGGDLPIRY
jgi:hypothetical protein